MFLVVAASHQCLRAERPISQTNPELPQVGKQTEATQPLVPVLISKGCNDLKPNAIRVHLGRQASEGITPSPKLFPAGLSPMSTWQRRHPLLSTEQGVTSPSGELLVENSRSGRQPGPGKLGQAQPGLLPVSQPWRGLFHTKRQKNKAPLYTLCREKPAETRRL